MTTITVLVQKTSDTLPAGKTFNHTEIVVTDNSGATLDKQSVTGGESPPWSATFTGIAGDQKATATITDFDTDGNAIGDAITVTQSDSGGQNTTFPKSSGATISVS